AAFLGVIPILFGFGIPLLIFGRYALNRLEQIMDPKLAQAFFTSLSVALATAALTVGMALVLLYAVRLSRSRKMAVLVRIASIGYGLPGTILALGLLISLARFDNFVDALAREYAGFSTGLIFTGSAVAVVLACSIRCLAL